MLDMILGLAGAAVGLLLFAAGRYTARLGPNSGQTPGRPFPGKSHPGARRTGRRAPFRLCRRRTGGRSTIFSITTAARCRLPMSRQERTDEPHGSA